LCSLAHPIPHRLPLLYPQHACDEHTNERSWCNVTQVSALVATLDDIAAAPLSLSQFLHR
jgi:hypothetical protein